MMKRSRLFRILVVLRFVRRHVRVYAFTPLVEFRLQAFRDRGMVVSDVLRFAQVVFQVVEFDAAVIEPLQ